MKQRNGFTLISVIVAIVLLSVGVMALARTQFQVVRITRTENQRNQALQLASAYMEDVRSRDAWNLASEGPTTIDSTGAPNGAGTFVRQLVVATEGTQLVRVWVRVTPRGARAIELKTMIFRVSQ